MDRLRMIFAPGVITRTQAEATVKWLGDKNIVTVLQPQSDGRLFFVVNSPESVAFFASTYFKTKDYQLCDVCPTIHFRPPTQLTDPFVCPCGAMMNKIKIRSGK